MLSTLYASVYRLLQYCGEMNVILVQDSCVVMKVYTVSNLQHEQFDRKTG